MLYADVIVNISNENLDKTYQYIIPKELEEKIVIGTPVIIPFGKGNREIKGYVMTISDQANYDVALLKSIIRYDDRELAIEDQLISLAVWIKEQYGATLNEALHTVIPVKKKIRETETHKLVLSEDTELVKHALEEANRKKNLSARKRLLTELMEVKQLDFDIVVKKMGISRTTINSLAEKGIIKIESKRVYRNPISIEEKVVGKTILNEKQQDIADEIIREYNQGLRKTYLIHGVTGSGKTEVYIEVIEKVVTQGYQVILLIPEIALTYQTVKRFYERFGNQISILNSKMSAGERYDQSERAKKGEIDIMIGPRSALFAPFQNLGLIIIDEEHETSYKSEMPPKYHARETAVERARIAGASVILGSATPSLEAYHKVQSDDYQLFELNQRANDAQFPEVEIVDLREELRNGNKTIFSEKLIGYMKDRLDKKEQIILFLNRRGYAGFVSCRSCGQALKCPHCDISLTLHNNQYLVCHYCGHKITMPKTCPSCSSHYIAAFGTGTQKVEEQIKKIFPEAGVLRMDADTTKKKNSHEKILSVFAEKEADILIGTQMIVKGHDFPNVTLVGILAADLSLYASDYRASERTFQLLAQAAGRAGRGEKSGQVVIQTYQPEHYSIVYAATEDYKRFFEEEMMYRSLTGYPPTAHILAILMMAKDERKLDDAAELIKKHVKQRIDAKSQVIGPAPCSVAKINDIHRRVIYIKQKEYHILTDIKNQLEDYILESQFFTACSIQFDFNPLNSY